MPDTPDRVPLAEGWTIGVKPNASGVYWVYAPDGTASTYYSAQWLIEHGQPIPERPLAVGDRVTWHGSDTYVIRYIGERRAFVQRDSGGVEFAAPLDDLTRVVES